MAGQNLLTSSMWLVAILAIVAGNLTPVLGKRDLPKSLPAEKELVEGAHYKGTTMQPAHSMMFETGEDTPKSGSWNIVNNAGNTITAHCKSQVTDLGPSTINTQNSISHSFPIESYIAESWRCEFKRETLTGPFEQNFRVWAHDGSTGFLETCWDCEWDIRADGFYFKYPDGDFYLQWQWHPWNAHK